MGIMLLVILRVKKLLEYFTQMNGKKSYQNEFRRNQAVRRQTIC